MHRYLLPSHLSFLLEEKKAMLQEIANQKGVSCRAQGWKVHLCAAQLLQLVSGKVMLILYKIIPQLFRTLFEKLHIETIINCNDYFFKNDAGKFVSHKPKTLVRKEVLNQA